MTIAHKKLIAYCCYSIGRPDLCAIEYGFHLHLKRRLNMHFTLRAERALASLQLDLRCRNRVSATQKPRSASPSLPRQSATFAHSSAFRRLCSSHVLKKTVSTVRHSLLFCTSSSTTDDQIELTIVMNPVQKIRQCVERNMMSLQTSANPRARLMLGSQVVESVRRADFLIEQATRYSIYYRHCK